MYSGFIPISARRCQKEKSKIYYTNSYSSRIHLIIFILQTFKLDLTSFRHKINHVSTQYPTLTLTI